MLPDIRVLHGDCLTQIPTLPDRSIRCVVTSPPYAMQRKEQYGGVSEADYPDWMVSVFNAIRPKLTTDGSFLVNIRSHQKHGAVSDYVLLTRLALRKAGYVENEELIWHKPDAQFWGSRMRPRRVWENILWFSLSPKPYVNLKAGGHLSDKLGSARTKKAAEHYADIFHQGKKAAKGRYAGIAGITDMFTAPVSQVPHGIRHPAAFPPALAFQLIETFSKEDDTVLDPFAGSGTTLLAARLLRRHAVGVEMSDEYVDIINQRVAKVEWAQLDGIAPHSPDGWKMLDVIERNGGLTSKDLPHLNRILEGRRKAKLGLLR